MSRQFLLPDIGEGLTEAEIVRWLVAVGDEVEEDQSIVEVETDKAVVEIPSPYAGVVESIGAAEGEVLEVGQVLVVIGEGDSSSTEPAPESHGGLPVRPQREDPEPIVGTLDDNPEVISSPAPPTPGSSGEVKALPVVRKLARDHGIDLAAVAGSGPGGRIMREDVEALISDDRAPSDDPSPATEDAISDTSASEASARAASEESSGSTRQPMSRLRRTIAANMSKSWSEIPHVTTFDDVDATRLLEVRDALSHRHEMKIPLEALVIKAVLPALVEYPEFNATIDGDEVVYHSNRDVGIAVDTPEGLMVAVIRATADKSVRELADEVRRLGEGARERALGPGELTGQTFTVSNIGAVGGGHGTPIVPAGTTAILSVGRASLKPIVFDGDIAIAPVMPLSLSYDHRVIDGAQGRRFMALVMENLEEPALFLAG